MHIALISKNKERFIDGILLKHTFTYPLYVSWIRCDTMFLAWLQISITESIVGYVLWIDCAAGVWINLKTRFSQSDVFRIYDIQEELYKMRQGSMEVSGYFTKMKVLWDKLEIIDQILIANVLSHAVVMLFLLCGFIMIKTMSFDSLKGLIKSYMPPSLRLCFSIPFPY